MSSLESKERIQLKHPAGKKAPTMSKAKYVTLKNSLLTGLKEKRQVTYAEILTFVEKHLRNERLEIEGKLGWSLFWVMLDLEAQNAIQVNRDNTPLKYSLPG